MSTSTDLIMSGPPTPTLAEDMDYARTIAPAALLPAAYRGKPADVLVAVGLGRAIGIQPAQALYEIYVVSGRPSPSANLMAALVRRAGHRLRIEGDATRCTATLIRADDPEAPFTATWTIEQAQAAGLTGKDTWRQYPAAMLRARAISEVVRMGASEAVLGMDYSREEMQDVDPPAAPTQARPTGLAAVRAAAGVPDPDPAPEVIEDAVVVDEETAPDETGEQISESQRRALFASFTDAGFSTSAKTDEGRRARLDYLSNLLQRVVESTTALTAREASIAIDALKADAAEQSETLDVQP